MQILKFLNKRNVLEFFNNVGEFLQQDLRTTIFWSDDTQNADPEHGLLHGARYKYNELYGLLK